MLAASCKRTPSVGMKVKTESPRAVAAQKMVMELLVADQPARATSHDPDSEVLALGREGRGHRKPFPRRRTLAGRYQPSGDERQSRCLHPVRPVRARLPRSAGQRRHRHGVSQSRFKIVFDFDDPMGESTCVACGECVQACPTGALMPSVMLDENQTRVTYADREGRLAVPVLRRRLPGHLSGQGREGRSTPRAATARPTTTGSASRAASASTTSIIRIG